MYSDFACLVNKMTINDNLTNKNAITCLEVAGDCDLKGVDYSLLKLHHARELSIYTKTHWRF